MTTSLLDSIDHWSTKPKDFTLASLAHQEAFEDLGLVLASSPRNSNHGLTNEEMIRAGWSAASPGALMQVGASIPCPYGYGCYGPYYGVPPPPLVYGAPVVYGPRFYRRRPFYRRRWWY